MERYFDVFRQDADGSVRWIASTESMQSAKRLVRSNAVEPSEQFVIHNILAGERVYLRAVEAFAEKLPAKVQ
jgi:hypothetical protein